jgi:uncharacterized protein (TIRG00374 family)
LNIRVIIGVAFSAGLLWYSMRNVDFVLAWTAMQQMKFVFLVPYMALVVGEVPLRAWRWQMLLAPTRATSLGRLTSASFIGLMANNILPARAGEFVRAFAGARLEGLPFSTVFATVVIDRVFDGLAASAIFLVVVFTIDFPPAAKVPGFAATGLYLGVLIVLVALLLKQALTLRLIAAVLRFFPRRLTTPILGWIAPFVSGLGVFRRPNLLGGSLALSLIIWLGYGLTLYLSVLSFDIHLSVLQCLALLLVLTLALTLPSTPGFVGVMQFGVTQGLAFYAPEVNESQAFALAVVYNITQYVPITLAGFIALWRSDMGFGDITRRGDGPE